MKIIVQDTNILLDLLFLDLLESTLQLNYEFSTVDFVLAEFIKPEQKQKLDILIKLGKITIAQTQASEYSIITALMTKNLSFTDCAIWYYAKKVEGILLTGDAKLRKTAIAGGLEVRGIFYIFDQLVEHSIINRALALEKLLQLQNHNPRLPKVEFEKRIKQWSEVDERSRNTNVET